MGQSKRLSSTNFTWSVLEYFAPFSFRKFISNKAQGRTNKHTCAYQGVINVRFWKIWLALFSCFEIRSFVLLLTNYFMFNSKWEIFAYNLIIEESFWDLPIEFYILSAVLSFLSSFLKPKIKVLCNTWAVRVLILRNQKYRKSRKCQNSMFSCRVVNDKLNFHVKRKIVGSTQSPFFDNCLEYFQDPFVPNAVYLTVFWCF